MTTNRVPDATAAYRELMENSLETKLWLKGTTSASSV